MREEVLNIEVAGADGAAVGEKKTRRVAIGRFAGVFLIYTTQPDTCVVTVSEIQSGQTIVQITGNTDAGIFPDQLAYPTGVEVALPLTSRPFPLYGHIKVDVATGNAGSVKVRLRWER